jgi:hypothetical protein
MRKSNFSAGLRVTPDFVSSGALPVKVKSAGAKFLRDFAVAKS